jgi:hypothetical protein
VAPAGVFAQLVNTVSIFWTTVRLLHVTKLVELVVVVGAGQVCSEGNPQRKSEFVPVNTVVTGSKLVKQPQLNVVEDHENELPARKAELQKKEHSSLV